MKIVSNAAKMRELSRQTRGAGLSVGLVPTMGYLHDAHLELVRRAREQADVVVVSIFVNPTQFDRKADFDTYPCDEKTDRALLEQEGVDFLFQPEADDVYPHGAASRVRVDGITEGLCGAHRSGHFEGVTTVVAALFNIVEPDFAVFGEKDFQQLQTIRRMVTDLHFGLRIVAVPTVREASGLAMSSRNARLTDRQREQAAILYRGLSAAADSWDQGVTESAALCAAARDCIAECADLAIEYLEIVDARTLAPVEQASADSVIAVAATFGQVRLIDNVRLGRAAAGTEQPPLTLSAAGHVR